MRNRVYMRRHIFVLFCLAAAGAVYGAFKVEPTVMTMNAAMGEKTALTVVTNTGDAPVAVEFSVFERVLDLEGEFDRTNVVPNKDFTIYPSEVILHPGKQASVQLQYKGKERITEDKTYALFSKEVLLPLEEDETEAVNIKIPAVVSYYTIINIETGKEGRLTFVSSKAIKDGMIEVIAENKSGGRVSAHDLAIKTDADIIKNFTGKKNSIMPGQKRRFTFKYLRPLTSKEVKFIYDASD